MRQDGTRESLLSGHTALLFPFYAALIYTFGGLSYVVSRLLGPTKRGFFCNDPSIRYPYRDSTVDITVVMLVSYAILIINVVFVEFYWNKREAVVSKRPFMLFRRPLHFVIVRFTVVFLISQIGYMITVWFYNLCKYTCGRLRPHFLAVCQPNISLSDCPPNVYIENYECLGVGEYKLRDARLSFFSGHSATCFYFATFVIIYTYNRLISRRPKLTPMYIFFSTLILLAASFVGISRVFDYKHHADDVFYGAVEGALVASVISFCFSNVLAPKNTFPLAEANTAKKSLSDDETAA